MPLTTIEEMLNELALVEDGRNDDLVAIIRALICELDERVLALERLAQEIDEDQELETLEKRVDKMESDKLDLKIAERKAWEVGLNSICHYPECEKPATCVVQDTFIHTEPGGKWVNKRPFGPTHFYCEEHDRESKDVDFTSWES